MFQRTLKIYLSVLAAFVFPIILADQYYVDDIGRASGGYTMWGVDGRPFADYIMQAINFSSRLSDLAPLPIILSVAILSFVMASYRSKYFHGKLGWLVPLVFFANPAMISIISYRFDVLTFSCAIAFSFAPFLISARSKIVDFAYTVLMVIFVLGTYQTMVNLFAVLCIVEMFRNLRANENIKSIFIVIALRIASLLVGLFIYMKGILPLFFTVHTSNHPEISADLFHTLPVTAGDYYHFICENFFRSGTEKLIIISLSISVVCALMIALKGTKSHNMPVRIVLSIFAALSVIVSIPLSMAVQLVLSGSLITSVQGYVGIGGYLILFAALVYYSSERFSLITAAFIIPLFYNFGLVYAYGNALKGQDYMNKQIAFEIKDALRDSDFRTKYIVFNGASPRSFAVLNPAQNYPILNISVQDYFNNWYWANASLAISGIPQLYPTPEVVASSQANYCSYDIKYKGQDFYLFEKDDVAVVDFSRNNCGK